MDKIIKNKKGQPIDPVLFKSAFCNFCGSLRCEGIESEEWREGCQIFQDYPEHTPTIKNETLTLIPSKVFTIDFDNTCAFEDFPGLGKDVPNAVDVLKKMVSVGHRLILWTMRRDNALDLAIKWFSEHQILLWGINDWPDKENVYIKEYGESRKVIGDYNIDDRNIGCPLIDCKDDETGKTYQCVDWLQIEKMLIKKNLL